VVDPLPHQITAVYEAMLPRQPLRFLLADDPGAGKTIMAGLLMKELIARGDLQRCLVVCPGSLAEQWQDELWRRFHLPFEILTNDKLEAARTGNWFLENHLVIARLDKLSRDPDVQVKLEAPDGRWDLVVVDEAHKMSATFFGGEIKFTKRYRLGQLLSGLARHYLLMTATPHNGKEEDFQLFMALLDGDRFEGRFRDGVHAVDVTDLMRRMVKEDLFKFDGTPLFPERIAYTVPYKLSDAEARLYREVTDYVREEFNRAEALENNRRGTVGFALSTNRCVGGASAWRVGYGNSNCCNAAARSPCPQRRRPRRFSTKKMSKTWKTHPKTKSRKLKARSSIRQRQRAP
jgi:SNF2 family DNA or RNA helicase